MRVAEGRIVNGKLELDVPEGAEGASVKALLFEVPVVNVTEEEKQFLLDSFASGEVDNGRDFLEILEEMIAEEARS